MTTLAPHPPKQRLLPARYRWTREQYFHLFDLGYFAGKRVELIDGEIIHMPAQKNPHVIGVEKSKAALERAFGRAYWVRAQATLSLGANAAPDPDVAVVPGPRRSDVDYPTEAVLVVEVSDTTLWFDRTRKARTYARAGVPEYWVVDLVHRQLVVYRGPITDPARRPRHQYSVATILGPKDSVRPLAIPRASIRVAKLLP